MENKTTEQPYVTMSRQEGHYAWAHPSDRQAQIAIDFPVLGKQEKISACVEINGEYDIHFDSNTAPEEVIAAIKHYFYKGVWVSTDKERVLNLCRLYYANQKNIDLIWYRQHLASLKKKAEELAKRIKSREGVIAMLEDEIEQEKNDNGQFGVGA